MPNCTGPVGDPDPPARVTTLIVGGQALTIESPGSADDLLDALDEGDEIPFWAHLWDSAFGLVDRLEHMAAQRESSGKWLLELGTGVGTVGCAAARLGWRVVMTDYLPEALRYASGNLRRNGLCGSLVRAEWRRFGVCGAFDLVVGSDVLYDVTLHEPVAALLADQLRRGAEVLLADPGRDSALWFAAAREKDGWLVDLELGHGRDSAVAIYRLGAIPTRSRREPDD